MKDKNGDYWCLEKSGGKIHAESHCPGDFIITKKHQFRSINNDDDANVPPGQCAIQSVFDDSFIEINGDKLEAGSDSSPNGDKYHFEINDVGGGKVSIFSVKKNKYLKKEGHHAKAKESSDCGETCHFTIEEIDQIENSAGEIVNLIINQK